MQVAIFVTSHLNSNDAAWENKLCSGNCTCHTVGYPNLSITIVKQAMYTIFFMQVLFCYCSLLKKWPLFSFLDILSYKTCTYNKPIYIFILLLPPCIFCQEVTGTTSCVFIGLSQSMIMMFVQYSTSICSKWLPVTCPV